MRNLLDLLLKKQQLQFKMLAKIWLFTLVLPLTLSLSPHLSPALTLILRIPFIPMTMSPISLCLTSPFPLGTSFTSLYRNFSWDVKPALFTGLSLPSSKITFPTDFSVSINGQSNLKSGSYFWFQLLHHFYA